LFASDKFSVFYVSISAENKPTNVQQDLKKSLFTLLLSSKAVAATVHYYTHKKPVTAKKILDPVLRSPAFTTATALALSM
jgi:hypothetical protein